MIALISFANFPATGWLPMFSAWPHIAEFLKHTERIVGIDPKAGEIKGLVAPVSRTPLKGRIYLKAIAQHLPGIDLSHDPAHLRRHSLNRLQFPFVGPFPRLDLCHFLSDEILRPYSKLQCFLCHLVRWIDLYLFVADALYDAKEKMNEADQSLTVVPQTNFCLSLLQNCHNRLSGFLYL
jgi:hypothetical protein